MCLLNFIFYFGSSRLISQVGVLISRTFSVGWLTDDEEKSPTCTGYVLSTSSCEILKKIGILILLILVKIGLRGVCGKTLSFEKTREKTILQPLPPLLFLAILFLGIFPTVKFLLESDFIYEDVILSFKHSLSQMKKHFSYYFLPRFCKQFLELLWNHFRFSTCMLVRWPETGCLD